MGELSLLQMSDDRFTDVSKAKVIFIGPSLNELQYFFHLHLLRRFANIQFLVFALKLLYPKPSFTIKVFPVHLKN